MNVHEEEGVVVEDTVVGERSEKATSFSTKQ